MGMTHENNGPMVLHRAGVCCECNGRTAFSGRTARTVDMGSPLRYAFNLARNLSQFTGCTYSKSTSAERVSSPSLSLM